MGQFVLGYMNHRVYKKTEHKSKMAPVHAWLGRVVMVLGVVNGFLCVLLAPLLGCAAA